MHILAVLIICLVGVVTPSPFTFTAVTPQKVKSNGKLVIVLTLHTVPKNPVKFSFVLQVGTTK